MTWYLTDDGLTVTQDKIDNSIELTDAEGVQAIEAKRNGKIVLVKDGHMIIREPYSESEQKYIDFKAGKLTLSELEYADDATEMVKTDTYQNLYKDGHISKEVYLKYLKFDVDNKVASLISEVDAIATNAIKWKKLGTAKQNTLMSYYDELNALAETDTYPENVIYPGRPEFL